MSTDRTTRFSRISRLYHLFTAILRSRNAFDVAIKLIPPFAKRGFAWPVAILMHCAVRPLHRPPAAYRVLVIQKAIFNEDILQVFATWDEIQTYGIGRAAIKAMALAYLPPTVCDDATYVTADRDIEAAKLRYRQFCSRVWRRLQRLRHYDAVITANWSYWAERELTTALEQLGTPFLVLHKEGIKPPERSKLLRTMFVSTRGRFGVAPAGGPRRGSCSRNKANPIVPCLSSQQLLAQLFGCSERSCMERVVLRKL